MTIKVCRDKGLGRTYLVDIQIESLTRRLERVSFEELLFEDGSVDGFVRRRERGKVSFLLLGLRNEAG